MNFRKAVAHLWHLTYQEYSTSHVIRDMSAGGGAFLTATTTESVIIIWAIPSLDFLGAPGALGSSEGQFDGVTACVLWLWRTRFCATQRQVSFSLLLSVYIPASMRRSSPPFSDLDIVQGDISLHRCLLSRTCLLRASLFWPWDI